MSRVMTITAISTTMVDVTTSAFVGQATFFSSPRTSRRNSLGVVRSRCAGGGAGRRRLAALALHLALGLSVHSRLGSIGAGRAGQEGIEPPTAGFGDRCSAN